MLFIYLDIVEKFSCSQCGRCCRNDWLVTVDEAGYRRNRELFAKLSRDEEFRQAFIPLQGEADYGEYARIAKRASGGCWFLTDNHLCRLQQWAGHAHLDTVCQWFPRYPMDTERGIELSLSFSCPTALQLARREEPLRIVRSGQPPLSMLPPDFVTYAYPSQYSAQHWQHFYFALEEHLIDILQARRISWQDRLGIVRRSLECLTGWVRSDSVDQQLAKLFQDNYERLDTLPATSGDENTPDYWLVENCFVNFLFRKNLYSHGPAETLRQLELMQECLQAAMRQKSGQGPGTETVFETIVQLEMEYNHNRSSKNSRGK